MAHKDKHLAALLELSPDERLDVANALLDSLDADSADEDWEAAWATELNRRLDGLMNGTRRAVPASDVFANARARLDSSS